MTPDFDIAILAGGGGTRLWPMSRGDRAKQFLCLPHDRTLIEQAVERAFHLVSRDRVWIVTVASQVSETCRLLPEFPRERIIVEPVGRNSAPACALATLKIEQVRSGPTTIFICTADHFIPESKIYEKAVATAVARASLGKSLVTFGLKVRFPSTDFGYIEVSSSRAKSGVLRAIRFVEKPKLADAKKCARSNRYFWNSGMFVWRSDFFKKEMSRGASKIYKRLVSAISGGQDLADAYDRLPNISIDYALMEKSKSVDVVPSHFEWSDVGTWAAVYDALAPKKGGNAIVGKGVVLEGKGNFVHSTTKPVVVLGVDHLVVVETDHATMVIPREKSKDLKRFLAELEKLQIT